MKCKQPCPRFELTSIFSFPMILTVIQSAHLPKWFWKYWVSILIFDKVLVFCKCIFVNRVIKNIYFQVAVVSVQLYGCTTWTLTRHIEKKLDGNCIRMLRAISNKSWKKHPTKQQCMVTYHLSWRPSKLGKTRHVRHWRSKDEFILWFLLVSKV